jgi:lipid-A-disaccharide synthase
MKTKPVFMLIAGEISGDMHAAPLVRAIRQRCPDATFFGIGGPALRAAGMETIHDISQMAVMGISEVLRRYGFFRRVFHEMIQCARERRPDAVILVDYPGFNLRLAARLHAMGIRTCYYVCPQVWAWNRGRIPSMAKVLDLLLCIFPFEPPLFTGTGLRAEFVGHPLVDAPPEAPAQPSPPIPWPAARRAAILPGSRRHEVERILPALWAAACRISDTNPDTGFVIACPTEEVAAQVRNVLAQQPRAPAHWALVMGDTPNVLRQAHAAWVASGTATIEAALMRCPMLVVYKVAALTYWIARAVVRIPYIGMVNIVAGRTVCPEFIQHRATPENLAEALRPLLDPDDAARTRMLADLDAVVAALGKPGAATRAAELILETIG